MRIWYLTETWKLYGDAIWGALYTPFNVTFFNLLWVDLQWVLLCSLSHIWWFCLQMSRCYLQVCITSFRSLNRVESHCPVFTRKIKYVLFSSDVFLCPTIFSEAHPFNSHNCYFGCNFFFCFDFSVALYFFLLCKVYIGYIVFAAIFSLQLKENLTSIRVVLHHWINLCRSSFRYSFIFIL